MVAVEAEAERRRGTAGPEAGHRRADIEGLRAVAVLLVVAYHAGLPVPGGFTGVDVFFVISGFVITGLLLRELDGTGRVDVVRFYARRIRRMLPALALMIVVVCGLSSVALSPFGPQGTTAKTGASASVFLANRYLYTDAAGYFGAPADLNALLHTWSLSVEEQFYLVFPAVLLVAWAIGRRAARGASRREVAIGVLLAVVAGSFVLSLVATDATGALPLIEAPQRFAFYASPTRAWEFGAGALLALAVPLLLRMSKPVAVTLGLTGAGLVALGAFAIDDATPFPGTAALLPVVGTALVIAAGTATAVGVTALLGVRPAVLLGALSYSWYLWHWPIIVMAKALWPGTDHLGVVAAAASLVPAVLAYRYVENPLRRNRRIAGRGVLGLAAICIALPLAASLALGLASRAWRSPGPIDAIETATRLHADVTRDCDSPVPLGERSAPQCTWTVEGAAGRVVLMGDSQAGQFTEPFVAAANDNGLDATVATSSACPVADLVAVRGGRVNPLCRTFLEGTIEELVRNPPTMVVIASATTRYVGADLFVLRDPITGDLAESPRERAALWERGTASVLERLNAAGVPVVVIHSIPYFDAWDYRACAAIRLLLDADSCGTSQPLGEVEETQSLGRDAEQAAVDAAALATAVDFSAELCPGSECSTHRGDMWMYRDSHHLTIGGARTLTDRFRAFLPN